MELAGLSILLFDLGEAILPSRPRFNSAAVSSGGQGWPPLSGHPKGWSLTAANAAAGFGGAGWKSVDVASFRFPCPLQKSGSGTGKPIKKRERRTIYYRAHAH